MGLQWRPDGYVIKKMKKITKVRNSVYKGPNSGLCIHFMTRNRGGQTLDQIGHIFIGLNTLQ